MLRSEYVNEESVQYCTVKLRKPEKTRKALENPGLRQLSRGKYEWYYLVLGYIMGYIYLRSLYEYE